MAKKGKQGLSREQKEDDKALQDLLLLSDEQKAVLNWITERQGGTLERDQWKANLLDLTWKRHLRGTSIDAKALNAAFEHF